MPQKCGHIAGGEARRVFMRHKKNIFCQGRLRGSKQVQARSDQLARAALVFIGRIAFAAHGQQQRMHPGCVHGMHIAHALKNLRHQRPCEFMDKVAKDRILLRRTAHGGKGPDGTFAVVDGVHLEYREVMREAVIAHMVAKRPFRLALGQHVPADAKIRLREHRQGQTRHCGHLCAPAAEQSGKAQFRKSFGQGHDRSHGEAGRPAHINMHGQGFAHFERAGVVRPYAPVNLVVQPHLVRRVLVAAKLHPVHAEVGGVRAGLGGVFAVHQRQGNEGAAVHGPADKLGQVGQFALAFQHRGRCRRLFRAHPAHARQHVQQAGHSLERLQGVLHGCCGVGLGGQHSLHRRQAATKNKMQALTRAKKIGEHGKGRALDPRKQQGRSLGAKGAPLDGGQFQMRINLGVNAHQMAVGLKISHAFLKIAITHECVPSPLVPVAPATASNGGCMPASVRLPASMALKSARICAWSKTSGCGRASRG